MKFWENTGQERNLADFRNIFNFRNIRIREKEATDKKLDAQRNIETYLSCAMICIVLTFNLKDTFQ